MQNGARYVVTTHWGTFSLDAASYQDYLAGKLWISWTPGKPQESRQNAECHVPPNVTDRAISLRAQYPSAATDLLCRGQGTEQRRVYASAESGGESAATMPDYENHLRHRHSCFGVAVFHSRSCTPWRSNHPLQRKDQNSTDSKPAEKDAASMGQGEQNL